MRMSKHASRTTEATSFSHHPRRRHLNYETGFTHQRGASSLAGSANEAKCVIFRLRKYWQHNGEYTNVYKEIKEGRKTSEWREDTEFWRSRLLNHVPPKQAWFTIGYPKNNSPRLEADILKVIVHENLKMIEIRIGNVEEKSRGTSVIPRCGQISDISLSLTNGKPLRKRFGD
jgi:hypothetical protein